MIILGEKVGNVVLPNWAETPIDFVTKMRQALESEHVTKNLHKWIDLIFGDKQKGENAFYANNLFYPMTYEDNVKLDEWSNEYERTALEFQIQRFGQTPIQLFTEPHCENNCRKILISQPTLGSSAEDEVVMLKKELETLKLEMKSNKKKHEDDIGKQLKEFKVIETKRKKKYDRLKSEFDGQIEEYESLLEKYKKKNNDMKEKMQMDFKGNAK